MLLISVWYVAEVFTLPDAAAIAGC